MLLHVNCSVCGRAYGAKRVMANANYCSTSCKSKAYRNRKKQADLAKIGTFDMNTYEAVKKVAGRYGVDLENDMMKILEDSGANALRDALVLLQKCLAREARFMELGLVEITRNDGYLVGA